MEKLIFIEKLIVGMIVITLIFTMIGIFEHYQDKNEFMSYCQRNGNSEQDCKWEWKRLENGQKSGSILF